MRISDAIAEGSFLSANEADARSVESVNESVAEIFEAMRQPIYRYLSTWTGTSGDAEDLTQEVFLRLHAALSERRKIRNLRAWLFRVAHNLAVDWQRTTENTRSEPAAGPWSERPEAIDPVPSSEAQMLASERALRVGASLAMLSQQERHCLELRVEGLRYREIAEVLGIGISTVQTFLARAVRKLEDRPHE